MTSTFRPRKMNYRSAYIFAFFYYGLVLHYNITKEFIIGTIIVYGILISYITWILWRNNVKFSENEIQSIYFQIRKRVVKYHDIKTITLEEYKMLRGSLTCITITDKKERKMIYIPCNVYKSEDIKEMLEFIESKTKKVKIDIDIQKLFLNGNQG